MASAFTSLAASSRYYVPLALLSALLLLPRACSGPAEESDGAGRQWAVLVAGSSGYANYRHQADVCHAYQLLRKGGLKEENIVVFMYDDVARDPLNPRPGILINHPEGGDVYAGVPKDYTGKHVTSKNLFAAVLGNKDGVDGGSGKVVDSGPNDRIFIYYTDHGGAGVLGMPNEEPNIYASDLIKVLKKKHASRSYKEMVIYVEACESGSIFDGLLPEDLNIYVVTASNAIESSYAAYCPGTKPPSPPEYITCLGDLFSISWMEDSDTHDQKKETIGKQYQVVKERTSNNNTYDSGSHVMEYGNKSIKAEKLYLFQGFKPTNVSISDDARPRGAPMGGVDQRDADLLFLWQRYEQLDDGSENKPKILKEITETVARRTHLDSSVDSIGKIIFGEERGPSILKAVRPPGQALVDDWDCLKSMVHMFESHCGPLTQYGLKHMRAFANICNWGITKDSMEAACIRACQRHDSVKWRARNRGYSA